MSSSLLVTALVAVLYAAGIYLLLDSSLTRVLLGVLVLGNATNLLVVSAGGRPGAPALVGRAPESAMSDALVQALVLTAIVITLGVAAFLLALIHRTWALDREDDVTPDPSDVSVRRRLESDEQVDEDELDTTGCEAVTDTDSDSDSDTGTDIDDDRVPAGAPGARDTATGGPAGDRP